MLSENEGMVMTSTWIYGFTCRNNQIPDESTRRPALRGSSDAQTACSRIDLLGLHDDSRGWLERHGYTADLGG
jgi:hypothetical protein